MKPITVIQANFEKQFKREEFAYALSQCDKDDLINFIVDQQKAKAFVDFEDLGDYNNEYMKHYGNPQEEVVEELTTDEDVE